GVQVTIERLRQYGALKREIKMLERKLDILYDRKDSVPEVMGKVTGSSSDFPYTEVRTTVQMNDPIKEDALSKLIRAKENRLKEINQLVLEIEQYIAAIPDSTVRQLFELVFVDGTTYERAGEQVGYSKGRVSQLISKQLKD
ncbi:MAG: sigma factor-like helix-turn-helix DNA-binding protein, partial [Eubacteriales bacterium]